MNTQKDKTRFRSTVKWKKFREFKKKQQDKKDYITGKPLYKYCNCHHMDLNPAHYEDLSNPDNFITVNKRTHETIHTLYNDDRDYMIETLNKYKEILLRMWEINHG